MQSIIVALLKLLESAFPTIVGGLITLSAFWLKERVDRARLAQEWFEQTYVVEGVDRLLYHVGIERLQLATLLAASQLSKLLGGEEPLPGIERMARDERAEALPVEALVKLELLVGVPSLTASVFDVGNLTSSMSQLPASNRSIIQLQEMKKRRDTLYENIASLRKELLTIRIKHKTDIYSVHKREHIQTILKTIDKSNQAWVSTIQELVRRESQGM